MKVEVGGFEYHQTTFRILAPSDKFWSYLRSDRNYTLVHTQCRGEIVFAHGAIDWTLQFTDLWRTIMNLNKDSNWLMSNLMFWNGAITLGHVVAISLALMASSPHLHIRLNIHQIRTVFIQFLDLRAPLSGSIFAGWISMLTKTQSYVDKCTKWEMKL